MWASDRWVTWSNSVTGPALSVGTASSANSGVPAGSGTFGDDYPVATLARILGVVMATGGILALMDTARAVQNPSRSPRPFGAELGVVLIVLGVASIWYL